MTGSMPCFYIKNPDFYPLQYLLMQIQSNMDYIAKSSGLSSQVVGAASGLPKGNWSYGHGGCGNLANCNALPILPTLFRKRFNDWWGQGIKVLNCLSSMDFLEVSFVTELISSLNCLSKNKNKGVFLMKKVAKVALFSGQRTLDYSFGCLR